MRTPQNLERILNTQPSFDEIRKANALEAKRVLTKNKERFQNLKTIRINNKLVIQVSADKSEAEIQAIVTKFNNHLKSPFIA